jgi:hypothetical protein
MLNKNNHKNSFFPGGLTLALILCSLLTGLSRAYEPVVTIHGAGWVEIGQIVNSSDTADYYHKGAPIRRTYGHISSLADLGPNWEGSLGIGASITHESIGRVKESKDLSITVDPYIKEARFTYFMGGKEKPSLKLTCGYFDFNYNPAVRNLGLYLLRGPVYPGILFSGFETREISTRVNDMEVNARAHILGLNMEHHAGPFTQNLILSSEMDLKPVFDYSLAYLARFSMGGFLQLGAGINFYHLFAIQPKLTNLDQSLWENIETSNASHTWDRLYSLMDTLRIDTLVNSTGGDSIVATVDTTVLSHKGIKTVAFFNLDLKPLIGMNSTTSELQLYGEIGIIGLNSYNGVFGDLSERMPVMLGFNFPVFGLLDNFSFEVEWYGARFRDDYQYLMNNQSPLPASNTKLNRTVTAAGDSIRIRGNTYPNEEPFNVNNVTKDNWKWSLHASKVIQNSLRISAQVANDHFRFKSNAAGTPLYEAATTKMDLSDLYTDWYWVIKASYFF